MLRTTGLLTRFLTGDEQYVDDNDHWAVTSEQNSTCSIEPASAEDITAIVRNRGKLKKPLTLSIYRYKLSEDQTFGLHSLYVQIICLINNGKLTA